MEPVYLRALELGDLDRITAWHNDLEMRGQLVSPFRFTSRSAEEEWLRAKAAYSESEVNLAICLRGNGEHIGNVYLRSIDWIGRHAELGILIGDRKSRGKGYGTAATQLVIRHAFDDLGLHRIHLSVLAGNSAAIRVYEKCGFAIEGRLRSHAYKAGEYQDLVIMGLLRAGGNRP